MNKFPTGGVAERPFTEVMLAFRANFAAGSEVGAAACVYHQGKPVVDLWGGFADEASTDPWRADTLGVLASPTKSLVTGAALVLVDQGVLELDTPIAHYWPEFGVNGKDKITLRMVLSQRSGVVCLDHDPITREYLRTHTPIAEAIAAAKPEWEPDTAHGYHATTFGHLISELIRRRTGLTVGAFFSREIGKPLGLDCYIGLSDPETAHLAHMIECKAEELMTGADPGEIEELRDPTSLTYRATMASMSQDPADPTVEEPSYGGLASAQSLARYFASFIGEVDGFRLISPAVMRQIREVHSTGDCLVMLSPCTWGLGMQVADSPVFPAEVGLGTAFGFSGANGVFAFADPENELAFAYVPNAGSEVMGSMDDRIRRLTEAVYRSVKKSS
ncbi:serine hydrolase domain-containing protein [Amycolatopsis palatopharyngis]|uniref:serine hydrolase domain-containing protein n=1 Tax=Amycolatopsis palatopharyngis TaxID=187982 RepID=UPI001FEB45D2|nr:serine hydrolase domain-containing protein [Amycolatopsis palatopharyngis]